MLLREKLEKNLQERKLKELSVNEGAEGRIKLMIVSAIKNGYTSVTVPTSEAGLASWGHLNLWASQQGIKILRPPLFFDPSTAVISLDLC